ncbi:MAG: CDP-alcohol phosphatidyltransferase family protein [Phenylobacterium sp.]|uniref:CDP-alcohol phosphatidyltransferase family protein n=1 Tax=Phenylobacterium sp. TaxID=1871053 RepID=UPI0025E760A5|nr:CDP-alcohol phosphatidyltransferase family protein [Phenylobacterium sp.]MCA6226339.1 CDP-alcohol phosphatidyltransferase family protein [Phenylobacterium sp.]MCA6231247.1 CDP-alcohol phosphatidyltransferase family protein [Phenylobacterium sp.]MCA6235166.1 CDP-alcohol phosphatidyltransferase family protein [Phenylobacterium sp.]MCA6250334.1 CDP-alcohol phosphatidyltransferase family protein [Phenylobacterium sp.]MCA6253125.1 CDP-alcohol phosphatidyltransferase family protein [Phenylobacter
MFDARLRPLIDPALNRMGAALARRGVSANQVSAAGAACGALAGLAIGLGHPLAGLALILASRLLDGLDGAVARHRGTTDLGGYLDIVCDYVFYLAIPLGFGFAAPANLPFALLLTASFTLTAVSFLAYATLAAKRGLETQAHGLKSFFYSTGLAEGAETLLAFVLMCLWPAGFPIIASVFAALCILTVIQRSVIAARVFR